MINNKFIIITTCYNCAKYIENCLNSVKNQTYSNFEFYLIDDCSIDGTSDIILQFQQKFPFAYIKNTTRIGSSLFNMLKAINISKCDKEDIIVLLDGDDWFANNDVLLYLNQVYQDINVFMTHGQYEPLSKSYSNLNQQILDSRTYRKSDVWTVSHLKTFKRKVWDMIKDVDFKDQNGQYFKYATDAAYLYPLIELCGVKRIKFISDILYIYNDLNDINIYKTHSALQIDTCNYIKSKKEYEEIL